ncbi:MAG: response regulator transcription factor [Candidatus Krumholzibacteriota bacterium]|nr:response regulator transcription factor [Candidatus Krumholzibacteriota bacterium]
MKKILVIEDSRLVSELLKVELGKRGYEAVVRDDGLEGLKTAKEIVPDLVILDVMLPSMNGFKICRLLKFDKRFKKIPVIMLTTRSLEDDKKIGMTSGADGYMAKPFNIDELVEKIESLTLVESKVAD